jgi:hypothetical protein
MAEGPLVSVQHRLSAARTLASRARNSCAAAQHLTATLPPNHRPRVPSRPTLSLRRSGKGHSTISPPHPTPLSVSPLLRLRRAHHADELLHSPLPSSIHRGCSTLPLTQEHREELRTATPPLLYPPRRPSPVRASLPAPLCNPLHWRLCPTPPVISPPYRKRGKHRIP